MALTYRYLFGRMVREEWRMHAQLFGGRRFALFPAFVALVAAGTTTFFALADADTATLVAGLHLVVLVLGLQVGTVGLVGRDSLEGLLGETTLLLFSARTLPVSARRLLLAFLLKDVAYYAALFLLPLTVGVVPLAILGAVAYAALPVLFFTSSWMFALGVAVSLALVGLATRSRPAATLVGLALVAATALRGGAVLAVTPYQLYVRPTAAAVAGSVLLPLVAGGVGALLFEYESGRRVRTAENRFRALHRRLGRYDEQGALAKSLLDVSRSSGGLWKVAFSQGLVFAVLVLLLTYLPEVVPVPLAPGLTIATIMALGSFTTYNWLSQFEDERFYCRYPVRLATVFRAKLRAFAVLGLPAGLGFLALGGVVFGFRTALLGLVVFPLLSLYVFGVTVYVAGLQPTDLLFDTPVFALFTVAMMAVLLPLVIVAIAYPLAPIALSLGALGLSVASAAVGLVAYRRAGPRWERKVARGDR